MKDREGITLISLVITIIILIILAGISIAALTEKNGLFKQAKQAKENMTEASEKENETIDEYSNMTNQILGNREIAGIDLNNMNVLATAKASTSTRSDPKSSVTLTIPNQLESTDAILITVRSSYWWDSAYADNISGDYDEKKEIYRNGVGCNTNNAGTSTSIQAGNATVIYILNGLKKDGKINISGSNGNSPQIQAILLGI